MDGERLDLETDDGVRIAATRFRPSTPATGGIVVGGATAVPRGFYRRFAVHAAAAGFDVLTLDYRGTGDSRPASLRGYRMRFDDWARYDLDAAIDALDDARPRCLVGHSYGGTALGFLPDTDRLAAVYAFGSGTGWGGWMSPAERMRTWFLWNVAGPALIATHGYMPWSRTMGGEDLPSDAFWGWRRWCRYPQFAVGDPKRPDAAASYASVRIPLHYAAATDDAWAPPASRDAMLRNYTTAPRTAIDVEPADVGLESIGHMGYFRAGAEPLWDQALETLAAATEAAARE